LDSFQCFTGYEHRHDSLEPFDWMISNPSFLLTESNSLHWTKSNAAGANYVQIQRIPISIVRKLGDSSWSSWL